MRHLFKPVVFCVPFLAWGISQSYGQSIYFTNQAVDYKGGGFGNVLNLLTLQDPGGGDDLEWGSVLWDGTEDVFTNTDDVATNANKTATHTVADLDSLGITKDTFGLILNINEAGNPKNITLHDFTLVFLEDDADELFTLSYMAPEGGLLLEEAGGGVGGYGWLFGVTFSETQAQQFFSESTNRVGIVIEQGSAIANVSDGPETFLIGLIPEPATVTLLGLAGLFLLGYLYRCRTRKP